MCVPKCMSAYRLVEVGTFNDFVYKVYIIRKSPIGNKYVIIFSNIAFPELAGFVSLDKMIDDSIGSSIKRHFTNGIGILRG